MSFLRIRARSKDAIDFAREERTTSNHFSQIVWQIVRNRQMDGLKFRREFPIPPYTADFCCIEHKLIIEVDGDSHFTEQGQILDQERDLFLRGLGYQILRVRGFDVIDENVNVLKLIQEFVNTHQNRS